MYSLLSHNTFGIDVYTERFQEYASVEELKTLIAQGALTAPSLYIGGGNNPFLVKDCEGLVLHSRIEGIGVTEKDERSVAVWVRAGVVWDDFVGYCAEHDWYGAENPSPILGEAEASTVQNISAYGVEVKDLIISVETVNIHGEERAYAVDECGYTYRDSIFKRPENKFVFVTYACFRLSKEERYILDYDAIRQELEKYPELILPILRKVTIDIRESKLPGPKVMGDADSFFMNPIVPREKLEALQQEFPRIPFHKLGDGRVKIPVGWMISQCGWKGKALGPATVHDKQALVLVNRGGAKDSNVLTLSDAIRVSVRAKFGIDIHPEVNLVGK